MWIAKLFIAIILVTIMMVITIVRSLSTKLQLINFTTMLANLLMQEEFVSFYDFKVESFANKYDTILAMVLNQHVGGVHKYWLMCESTLMFLLSI